MKYNIGELKKLLENEPEMAETVAFAQRIILITAANFGDFTSFIVCGREETTPEIVILKSELLKFAHEVIDKYEK